MRYNTIELSASDYVLTNAASGELLITNASSLAQKTLSITGTGPTSSIIASTFNWRNRIFEVTGSTTHALNVVFQGLAIEGGHAQNAGAVGGNAALGGGLLIENAAVTLNNVFVQNNQAQGAIGGTGAAGHSGGHAGGPGGNGHNAGGGGIYLASGTLRLFGDTISNNEALGGPGGEGGKGGGQGPKGAAGVTGGEGGAGGDGGNATGGGVFAAGGAVVLANDTFKSNQAIGGPGGQGGSGGSGGRGEPSAMPPVAGKRGGLGGAGGQGGSAGGGAIYLAVGSLSVTFATFQSNSATGGAGGLGGTGGPGTAEIAGTTGIFGGSGTLPGLTGLTGLLGGQGGPGGSGGPGGNGGAASGGAIFVAGGTLTLGFSTLAANDAVGGAGGIGGRGGTAGFGGVTALGLPVGDVAGGGGTGGTGGSAHGGGFRVAGGTVVLLGDTLNGNSAKGGAGGTGGLGGSGPIALVFGGTGIVTGTGGGGGGGGGTTSLGFGGSGINSAGPGGAGGNGANGYGGGFYVSGGALTLANATVADNTADAGSSGSGGKGGHAGTGNLTGGPGIPGSPGSSFGGGAYVGGGTVNLFNSTIALNIQNGTGSGGGVVQAAGTVTAVSTLFGGNGAVDYSGNITATDCLFQTAPTGTVTGSGNIDGKDPLLATAGLQSNGGPTQTIALQATSPAIDKGANPQGLLTDQRGFSPRTGSGGTDIGAYQHDAASDTQHPTAILQATNVTGSNAASLNPYAFTITFTDNVGIAAASLSGIVVDVVPPGAIAPITATLQKSVAVGKTDAYGDAQSFVVTFEITPPGGAWTPTDNGTYSVTLGGTSVIDPSGNAVPLGSLGTFTVAASPPSPPATASFVGTDMSTKGNWIGVYGTEGYDVVGSGVSNPTYATITPSGQSLYTWTPAPASSATQALEVPPTGASRIASVWYSATSFTVDVNVATGHSYDLELYFLDYDARGRAETVTLSDANTSVVLNTQTVSNFVNGEYLSWTITGNVLITFTRTAGANAVVSGLFFDPSGSPPPPTATASFVGSDTSTKGNWIGVYGTEGYDVVGSGVSNPTYATITPSGQSLYTWTPAPASSATQALEVPPTGASRIASVWYSATSFTVDVNVATGHSYDLELYFLDYDAKGRAETVTLSDANTSVVLNTQTVSNFVNGEYLSWTITGDVLITFTRTAGANAVVSGLFFDPSGSPPPPTATASFVGTDTSTKGNWIGVYGTEGYDVVGSGVSNPTYATITPSGQSLYTWTPAPASSATQALEVPPTGASRIASVWYSATSFTVDVNVATGHSYDLELYFLDYDAKGRAETVTLSDANTSVVLNTQTVSNFVNGEYLSWTITGDVLITFTRTAGANAVVSGLFFDPAPTGSVQSTSLAAPSARRINYHLCKTRHHDIFGAHRHAAK